MSQTWPGGVDRVIAWPAVRGTAPAPSYRRSSWQGSLVAWGGAHLRATLVLLMATACSSVAGDVSGGLRLESPLEDGRTVADLIRNVDSVALVVFRPEECYSCNSTLVDAVQRKRLDPASVRLLLTETPSPGQERVLARFRITWDGVLKQWEEAGQESRPGPWVFMALNGQILSTRR